MVVLGRRPVTATGSRRPVRSRRRRPPVETAAAAPTPHRPRPDERSSCGRTVWAGRATRPASSACPSRPPGRDAPPPQAVARVSGTASTIWNRTRPPLSWRGPCRRWSPVAGVVPAARIADVCRCDNGHRRGVRARVSPRRGLLTVPVPRATVLRSSAVLPPTAGCQR